MQANEPEETQVATTEICSAAEEHALLDQLIEQFKETTLAVRCETAEGAADMCYDVSVSFAQLLHSHGIAPQLVTLVDDMETTEHVVVEVSGRYIDWSAAQFEDGLGSPHEFDDPERYGFATSMAVLRSTAYDPSYHRCFFEG